MRMFAKKNFAARTNLAKMWSEILEDIILHFIFRFNFKLKFGYFFF